MDEEALEQLRDICSRWQRGLIYLEVLCALLTNEVFKYENALSLVFIEMVELFCEFSKLVNEEGSENEQ